MRVLQLALVGNGIIKLDKQTHIHVMLCLYCRPVTTAERSKAGRFYSDLKAKHELFMAVNIISVR